MIRRLSPCLGSTMTSASKDGSSAKERERRGAALRLSGGAGEGDEGEEEFVDVGSSDSGTCSRS